MFSLFHCSGLHSPGFRLVFPTPAWKHQARRGNIRPDEDQLKRSLLDVNKSKILQSKPSIVIKQTKNTHVKGHRVERGVTCYL